MSRQHACGYGIALLLAGGVLLSTQRMADRGKPRSAESAGRAKSPGQGIDYLKSSQGQDGAFAPKLAGRASPPSRSRHFFERRQRPGTVVAKGLDYLASQTKDDGASTASFSRTTPLRSPRVRSRKPTRNASTTRSQKAGEFIRTFSMKKTTEARRLRLRQKEPTRYVEHRLLRGSVARRRHLKEIPPCRRR